MPRALWWFRWSAVVTVLVGIAYWMHIVASDVRSASAAGEPVSPGTMFGSFSSAMDSGVRDRDGSADVAGREANAMVRCWA